jgi:hypothetical protein
MQKTTIQIIFRFFHSKKLNFNLKRIYKKLLVSLTILLRVLKRRHTTTKAPSQTLPYENHVTTFKVKNMSKKTVRRVKILIHFLFSFCETISKNIKLDFFRDRNFFYFKYNK